MYKLLDQEKNKKLKKTVTYLLPTTKKMYVKELKKKKYDVFCNC